MIELTAKDLNYLIDMLEVVSIIQNKKKDEDGRCVLIDNTYNESIAKKLNFLLEEK